MKQLKGKAENAKSERIERQLCAKYRSKDKEVKKSTASSGYGKYEDSIRDNKDHMQ